MIVYTAGRMRGILYYNFPAFDAARDALQARGHTVISPADLDREHGFDAMTLPPDYDWNRIPEGFDLAACIRRDVDAVLRCDALVFLPGDWTASIGCKSEFAVARWAGKPVYQLRRDLATMYEIDFDYAVVIRAAPHQVNDVPVMAPDQAAFNKRFDEIHGPRFDAAYESLMFVKKDPK
jgi:hypothetical protein